MSDSRVEGGFGGGREAETSLFGCLMEAVFGDGKVTQQQQRQLLLDGAGGSGVGLLVVLDVKGWRVGSNGGVVMVDGAGVVTMEVAVLVRVFVGFGP